jgi:catechol 2,3-dioxygenase-like lactoylglutathione lyase family enzyme
MAFTPSTIKMSFELVLLPVSDVDRARKFYSALGWPCDIDHSAANGIRIVQFTPPGSAGSIMFGRNITTAAPGSVQGLHLIVEDVAAAREDLLARGIPVSDFFHDEGGIFHRVGEEGRSGGPNPQRKSYASYVSFSDPDGNGWVIQEVTARLGPDLKPGDTRFTPQLVNAALGLPAP